MSEAIEGEIVSSDQSVRLTKHDEGIVQKLENAFSNFYNITEACQYAGISRETFYTWLRDDDIFSYRMSIAQGRPLRRAKEVVMQAVDEGDPSISMRLLMLRDPDFKPKAEVSNKEELVETREKIREFLNDTGNNDVSGEPTPADARSDIEQVADAPTDIS